METPLGQILQNKGAHIHRVSSSATVREAVREMNQHGIGSLMVVDNGQTVGIFTERDVLTRVIDAGRDPEQTQVAAVMTGNPVCVHESTTISEAMSVMKARRFRHLPITSESGQLIGILSIGDLIAWLVEDREAEIEQLTSYIAGSY
ncbi:MAG TPA: CBS domain-containing protein [Gammaproteobacteria bacterium]